MDYTEALARYPSNLYIPEDYAELRSRYISACMEIIRLRGVLRQHNLLPQEQKTSESAALSNRPGTVSAQIQLFLSLFCAREDVYARRWENARGSGYSPDCRNFWKPGICGKQKNKKFQCHNCSNSAYRPFDAEAVRMHLSGDEVFGVYAILKDDTCRFLAIDLDDESWRDDVTILRQVCSERGIPCYVEVSRSGNGAHVWFFLNGQIEAAYVRRFGTELMDACMAQNPKMTFRSYDRMFPNQDTLPEGGLGNLIALPLQRKAAKATKGSLFVDENFVPYPNQWVYLSEVRRIGKDDIQKYMEQLEADFPGIVKNRDKALKQPFKREIRNLESEDGTRNEPWEGETALLPLEDGTKEVRCVLANRLYVSADGISSHGQNQIKRMATFSNPEFYRKQALRQFIDFNKISRFICCASYEGQYLCLPRGCINKLRDWANENHLALNIQDKQNPGKAISVRFKGQLRDDQKPAFQALNEVDNGILVATTSFGKTVIGIALIAEKKVNTLIIVHTTQLLKQWEARLSTFLDIQETLSAESEKGKRGRKKERAVIGLYGAGKDTRGGIIDIALQQSLGRMENVKDWIKDYGMVIIDECHHCSAPTYEQVIQKASAKYLYGLTATPKRKDGHDPILKMYIGDIRYRVDAKAEAQKRPFAHITIPRFTGTDFDSDTGKYSLPRLHSQLAEDDLRNHLIVDDVISCVKEGRNCLILCSRIQHVRHLAELLSPYVGKVYILMGGAAKKATAEQLIELRNAPSDVPLVICATGKYVGEGFDEARLDTLFLTMPISWQGTLAQYAGRICRLYEGKREARIYDYIDSKCALLEKMYQIRLKGYASLGYSVGTGYEKVNSNLIYDISSYKGLLEADLQNAKESIIISSPYLSTANVRRLQPVLAEAARRGIKVTIRTKNLDVYKKTAEVMENAIRRLEADHINVEKFDRTFLKYAVIDSQICWYGSVSIMGSSSNDDSIMRLVSGSIARMLLDS